MHAIARVCFAKATKIHPRDAVLAKVWDDDGREVKKVVRHISAHNSRGGMEKSRFYPDEELDPVAKAPNS